MRICCLVGSQWIIVCLITCPKYGRQHNLTVPPMFAGNLKYFQNTSGIFCLIMAQEKRSRNQQQHQNLYSWHYTYCFGKLVSSCTVIYNVGNVGQLVGCTVGSQVDRIIKKIRIHPPGTMNIERSFKETLDSSSIVQSTNIMYKTRDMLT